MIKVRSTQSFYTKHFTKKNTQHLHLITMQSGTPLEVQCSSCRTYCLVLWPNVSELVWACTVWLSVIGLTCIQSLLLLRFHVQIMFKML